MRGESKKSERFSRSERIDPIRAILALGAFSSACVAGCLLPSFDGVEGGKSPPNVRPSSTSADAASEDSATPPASDDDDAAAASSPKPAPEIRCGSETCPLPNGYCCDAADGLHCRNVNDFGGPGTCKIQGVGRGSAFLCDGSEDCGAGESCCFNPDDQSGIVAKCAAVCGGVALCNAPPNVCPDGKSCKSTVSGGIRSCQ